MKRIFKFRQQKIGERNIDYQRAFDAALKAAQNAHDNKWVFYEDAEVVDEVVDELEYEEKEATP